VSLLADFEDDVLGVDQGHEGEVGPQEAVHLLVDVPPLLEGDAELLDDVVLLEVVLLLEADGLQTVGSQVPH